MCVLQQKGNMMKRQEIVRLCVCVFLCEKKWMKWRMECTRQRAIGNNRKKTSRKHIKSFADPNCRTNHQRACHHVVIDTSNHTNTLVQQQKMNCRHASFLVQTYMTFHDENGEDKKVDEILNKLQFSSIYAVRSFVTPFRDANNANRYMTRTSRTDTHTWMWMGPLCWANFFYRCSCLLSVLRSLMCSVGWPVSFEWFCMCRVESNRDASELWIQIRHDWWQAMAMTQIEGLPPQRFLFIWYSVRELVHFAPFGDDYRI